MLTILVFILTIVAITSKKYSTTVRPFLAGAKLNTARWQRHIGVDNLSKVVYTQLLSRIGFEPMIC